MMAAGNQKGADYAFTIPSIGSATEHRYDGEGRRVTKQTGTGPVTTFVYDAFGGLAAEYGTAPTETGTHYITADHLGSTRLVTDATGAVISRHDYLPFGEEIGADGTTRTTAMKYVINDDLTQRFTGKERDAETGLDYFGARYFSGAQGRFTSADPLMASANVANPQSWNRYVYANNNPLRYTDPSGLYSSPAFNCSEGNNACLNDDQRRILNASTVKIGGKEYSGEALYNKMDEKQQNAFVSVTDKLGSIKLEEGGTALGQVQSITGDPRKGKEGAIANDRIFANVSTSLEGAIKGAGNFASAPSHGPFSSSYKSTDGPLGNIQFSFQGTYADIDIDIGNMKAKGMGAILGGIVHTGEVIQNGLFGTTTNQDVVRKILLADPKVGITPSTDARFNRKYR